MKTALAILVQNTRHLLPTKPDWQQGVIKQHTRTQDIRREAEFWSLIRSALVTIPQIL